MLADNINVLVKFTTARPERDRQDEALPLIYVLI